MNTLQGILVLVLAGTVILNYFKVKRHFVFFLVKTRHGLSLLDKIAGLSPKFWGFWADSAVVFSFGGVGGAYLAKHGRQKNLYSTLFIIGLGVVAFARVGWVFGAALALAAYAAMKFLARIKSPLVGFATTAFVAYLLISNVFTVEYVSVLTSVFGAPALVLTGLSKHALEIVFGGSTLPGVSPLLPGSRAGRNGVVFPGYDIFVPWWFALIALGVTLLSHEAAHGILARVHGIRVKSAGLLTAGLLPIGAFVEPDEEEVGKSESLARMRVFAAGSFANMIVGAASAAIIIAATVWLSSFVVADGMAVVGTVEGYPAHNILEVGDVIKAIDGKPTPSLSSFRNATEQVKPGDEIMLTTERGDFPIKTAAFPENEGKAYIGIEMTPHQRIKPGFEREYGALIPAALFVLASLYWIAFFNANIALVNLLPLYPFDGFRMLRELVVSFKERMVFGRLAQDVVMTGVLVFTVILFALNALPLFGYGGP